MKKKIDVETTYTLDVYSNFNKFHFNNQENIRIILFIGLLVAVFFSVYSIISINIIMIIFSVTISILFLLATFTNFIPYLMTKEIKKNKVLEQPFKVKYSFMLKCLKVEINNQVNSYNYKDIYEVYDVKDYFYIYIDRMNCFIIGKKDLNKDQIVNLTEFLEKEFNDRYISR